MPLPFRIVAIAFAVAVCTAVFLASMTVAAAVVYVLLGLAGTDRMPQAGITAMLLLGQFLTVCAAMAATYATWLGLRWVWRGFRQP